MLMNDKEHARANDHIAMLFSLKRGRVHVRVLTRDPVK
jgi:hypothetical protein